MRFLFCFIVFMSFHASAQDVGLDNIKDSFYNYLDQSLSEHSKAPNKPFSKLMPEVWDSFIRTHFFKDNQFKLKMEVRLFGVPTSNYKEFFYQDRSFSMALIFLKTNTEIKAQLVNTETGYKEEHSIKLSPYQSVLFQENKRLEEKALAFFREQKSKTPGAIINIEFSLPLDKYDSTTISPFLFAIETRMKSALADYVINNSGQNFMMTSLKNINYSELPIQRQHFDPFPVKTLDKLSEVLSVLSLEQEHIINWRKPIVIKAKNIAGYKNEFKINGSLINWDLNNLPHTLREHLSESRGYYIDKILSVELPFSAEVYSQYYSTLLRNPKHRSHYSNALESNPALLFTQLKSSFESFNKLPSFEFSEKQATASKANINFYDNDPNVGKRYTQAEKDSIMKAIHNFSIAPAVDNIQQRNCRALF